MGELHCSHLDQVVLFLILSLCCMLFVGGECLLITKDMRQAEYLQVYLKEEAGYSG